MTSTLIRSRNRAWLAARLEKLAKRAAKIGLPFSFRFGAEVLKALDPAKPDKLTKFVEVVVDGAEPKIAGWSFRARIESTPEGNLVMTCPGAPEGLAARYVDVSSFCEHCRLDRNRKVTYIVQHDDGTLKQVGSSCLADFLGHGNPDNLLKTAELIADVAAALAGDGGEGEEAGWGGSGSSDVIALPSVFEVTHVAIRLFGWFSKKMVEMGGCATASNVISYFWGKGDGPGKLRAEIDAARTPEDRKVAADVVAWLDGLNERRDNGEVLNDYLTNLATIGRLGYMPDRREGLVVSAVAAYLRDKGVELTRKSTPYAAGHVGVIGKRMLIAGVVVTEIIDVDSQFGVSHLHKFVMPDGHRLAWFSSSKRLVVGKVYNIEATPKSHGNYKGRDETMLLRVAATEVAEASEEVPV